MDTCLGITNESDEPLGEILFPCKRIKEFSIVGIPIDCIHRKIASRGVLLARAKSHAFGVPTVRCDIVFAKGGDFKGCATMRNDDAPEFLSDLIAFGEELDDIIRSCCCCNIHILWEIAAQHFTNRSPHPPGIETGMHKDFAYLRGALAEA